MLYSLLYLCHNETTVMPYPTKLIKDIISLELQITSVDLLLIDGNFQLKMEDVETINLCSKEYGKPIVLYKTGNKINTTLYNLDYRGILHSNDDSSDQVVEMTKIIEASNEWNKNRSDSELLKLFLKYCKSYVFFKDENARVLKLSDNYSDMLGIPAKDAIGKTMLDIFPKELAESMVEDDLRIINQGEVVEVVEHFNNHYYKTVKFPVFREDKKPILAGFTIDITELKKTEEQLIASNSRIEELTITDELLGITNRRGFFQKMALEIERVQRSKKPSIFIIIDIDHFKDINDTIGHFKADEILKDFVAKVKSHLRVIDIFGRIGGDEFGIICTETHLREAVFVIERIHNTVNSTPVLVDDVPYHYSISSGLTLIHDDGKDMSHILQEADMALYAAKHEGKNCYKINEN